VIHTGTIHRILRPPSVPLTRRSTLVPPITKQPGHKYILSDLYLPGRMFLRFRRHFPDDGGKAPRSLSLPLLETSWQAIAGSCNQIVWATAADAARPSGSGRPAGGHRAGRRRTSAWGRGQPAAGGG